GTLLGAAQTVEMHHARLANWLGKDPFENRQGLVRIVPASDGLESEDSPFWWAGGFQAGDRTTVMFHWGSIAGLGRGLTHELTHRFDGRLFAFLPSWMVEGRAVHTGAAYGRCEDRKFLDRYLDVGAATTAFVKGYGGEQKLRTLIEGKLDDYRDNYTAGYALFVFLSSWRVDGQLRYAARLPGFMRGRGGRTQPLKWFTSCFVDGKDGRPAELAAFAKEFHDFLHGCYQWGWGNAPAWHANYEQRRQAPAPARRAMVNDEPTWVWVRDRAEPWFGQEHAARAGLLLAELGQNGPAIAALSWSLGTDDWQPRPARELRWLCKAAGHRSVAWIVGHELARRGWGDAPSGEVPLLASLPRLRAYLALLDEGARVAATKPAPAVARALLAERNSLAGRLGVAPAPLPPSTPPTPFQPLDREPHALALHGYVESGLTGYEERRAPGLWYVTDSGDLHVGRARPRKDSGLLDRTAHQRHAFTHSAEWFGPGSYVLKTRVHFTTSFVSGAVVLGYSRRDRNIRLGFSAGDFLYSIGRKQDVAKTRSVRLSVRGTWRREGQFRDDSPSTNVEFDQPTSHFDLEVRVQGATARVYAQGKFRFAYTTPDLSPIFGSIGFAMSQGAVRLQTPTVQPGVEGIALESADPSLLYGVRLPGVPCHPHGALVVWLPKDNGPQEVDEPFDHERWLLVAMRRMRRFASDKLSYPQPIVVMVPARLDKSQKSELVRVAKQNGADQVLEHQLGKPFVESVYGMYVDAWGGVRVCVDLVREGTGHPTALNGWARRSRAAR
ncbi:MAG: hypothetical protein KDC87_08315, partial [Planctomycetes bacterium]|nr:hypothetical protein [Planctomycetota bacterium]